VNVKAAEELENQQWTFQERVQEPPSQDVKSRRCDAGDERVCRYKNLPFRREGDAQLRADVSLEWAYLKTWAGRCQQMF
jgi:hypothetical protein